MSDMGQVLAVNDSEFDQIMNDNKLVLVDFWADWCPPCKALSPILEQIANERDITIAKVNTDTNQLKMGQFGFRGIPALVLYHNGQPVDQQAGALPKAGFDDWLNRHMN